MIDLERHTDNRDCRLTVGTAVPLVFSDETTQGPGNARAAHDGSSRETS